MHLKLIARRLRVPVVVTGALSMTVPGLAAQSRGATERILVLPPQPMNEADSSLAVAIGTALRDRMESKFRFDFRVIPTATICEALEASGFACGIVPPANAGALARFLQASGYVVGWLRPRGDSLDVQVRMVDQGRSGLAGWQQVTVARARDAGDIARTVADALEDDVEAAERARQCDERRQRSDFRGARQRAEQAFEKVPNHPAAAMCMSFVAEATQAGTDSVIRYLRMATTGDSLNARAWETLGRRLQERGDTAAALSAFMNQLKADPSDLRLRLGLSAGLINRGSYAEAAELLDEALAHNPADLQILRLKERACLDGGLWACALETLNAQYEVDSSLVGDSIFYAKAFGAAQSAGDTAAMLRWSREGVDRLPNSLDMWRARASALRTAGERRTALEAYDRVLAIDSTQIGAALAAAQILLDTTTLVIDSTVPVDTTRLFRADTLLQLVATQTQDQATLMNVALLYLNPGLRLVNQRIRFPLAIRLLDQAIRYDVQKRITTQANFFLGLALFFEMYPLAERTRVSESCDMVAQLVAHVRRTRTALETGASVAPQAANNLLQNVRTVEQQLPNYRAAFKCPGS